MGRRKNKETIGKIILALIVAIFAGVTSYFGVDIPEGINDILNGDVLSYETSFDCCKN